MCKILHLSIILPYHTWPQAVKLNPYIISFDSIKIDISSLDFPWMLSKDVVLALCLYLVKQVIIGQHSVVQP